MDYLESIRGLTGSALDALSRALYERDKNTFKEILVRLTKSGTMRDFEAVASMLYAVPVSARSSKRSYADMRFGLSEGDGYFALFMSVCVEYGLSEEECMPLLLSAQYGKKGGALRSWDKSADRYLDKLARADFELAADYIDKYDKKFGKYSVLIAVDRVRAINRLVNMALYGKHIDKAAVRDVLMDYDEVSGSLMSLYAKSSAHDRVAIVRLLLAFKNDGRVRAFLDDTAAHDRSKAVRDAVCGGMQKPKIKNAAAYLEGLMAEGVGLSYDEWQAVFEDEGCRNVADRIFFVMPCRSGITRILVYNDGEFLGSDDRPIDPSEADVISVLHPLDITEDLAAILPKGISQPFLQIERPIFHRISGERYFSNRLSGTMAQRDEFYINLKKFGFKFCSKRSENERDVAVYRLGKYVIGVECDMPKCTDTVSCGKLTYYNAADLVKLKRNLYISTANPLDLRSVPRKTFSELTYAAYRLFGSE